jgi:transposase-like protein
MVLFEGEDVASGEDLETLCAQCLRRARWPEQVRCPHCHSGEVTNIRQYMSVFQRYLCLACGKTFNDKTGTIFENSKVSLSSWAGAAYLLTANQPVTIIAENVGVSYPTALRMVRELRKSSLLHTLEEVARNYSDPGNHWDSNQWTEREAGYVVMEGR